MKNLLTHLNIINTVKAYINLSHKRVFRSLPFLFGLLSFLLLFLFFSLDFLYFARFSHPQKISESYLLSKGTSLHKLSLDLKKKKIIRNAFYFRFLAKLTGQYKLRAGEYPIKKHHTPHSLLNLFNSGKSITRPPLL